MRRIHPSGIVFSMKGTDIGRGEYIALSPPFPLAYQLHVTCNAIYLRIYRLSENLYNHPRLASQRKADAERRVEVSARLSTISNASSSGTTMPLSIDSGEMYPGSNLSISQLLGATKRKLQGSTFGGRFVGKPFLFFIKIQC